MPEQDPVAEAKTLRKMREKYQGNRVAQQELDLHDPNSFNNKVIAPLLSFTFDDRHNIALRSTAWILSKLLGTIFYPDLEDMGKGYPK